MPAVKQTLYITSQELCKILGINATELYDIELFFDANPDDEWELRERKDYKIVVASTGLREYTESGAYTIAKYLEAHHHKGFWQKLIENITEWFLHTKKKINQSFVKTKILNNSSSLIKRNNIFFISKKDVVKIFGTRSDYLRKMDEQARSIQFSLIKGEDYQEIDGELYYSLKVFTHCLWCLPKIYLLKIAFIFILWEVPIKLLQLIILLLLFKAIILKIQT